MTLTLNAIGRRTWGALDINCKFYHLNSPATQVFYSFCLADRKRGPKPGATEIECVESMQTLQKYDMRRRRDIRFNFVIAPDGNIYRGRGWASAPFLPHKFKRFNHTSVYIGHMGDFKDELPPDEHLRLKADIVKYGVNKGYISEKFFEINLKHTVLSKKLECILEIN